MDWWYSLCLDLGNFNEKFAQRPKIQLMKSYLQQQVVCKMSETKSLVGRILL